MATKGIEWVNKYHGRARDLANNDDNARGFYNTLQGTKVFEFGDDSAWDQDFEEQGAGTPPFGTDQIYADNVDICFFSGHGSQDGAFFGIANCDDGQAKPGELRLGNRELEWLVLDACLCLAYDSGAVFTRLDPALQGAHILLGFHTTTGDSASRGQRFADYLNQGQTVRNAWIHACEDTESSDVSWAYLRAGKDGTDTYNDHWWGKGYTSPDPVPPIYGVYSNGAC